MGSGPFKFVAYEVGQSIKGVRNPDYYHKGQPYLDAIVGIFADKQSVRVDALRGDRAAIEFRGLPPSARDQLVKEAGTGHRRAGQRLELRQHPDAQPQEEAVRRRARAPGAGARHRPVERRAGAGQDRQRPDGGRHRLPGLAAGRHQGGAAADRRLLAGHREVARRGQAAAEGGRRRGAEVRAAQPQRRPALQVRRHLGDRRVEEDRPQRRAEGRADRPVVLEHAGGHLRRGDGGQLPERGQSGARHRQVPAAHGLSGELRRLRRSEVDRALREDADRDRSQEAARRHARLREAHARHRWCTRSCCPTGTASSWRGPT